MAAVTAGLRLAEQVLFVFVASLWPNAVEGVGGDGNGGGGGGDAPEVFERFEVAAAPPAGEADGGRRGNGEGDGDETDDDEREERREVGRRREVVV